MEKKKIDVRFFSIEVEKQEFENIIRETIKNKTGLEPKFEIDADEETGFVRIIIDDGDISVEEAEMLYSQGFDVEEWYNMTQNVLAEYFNILPEEIQPHCYLNRDYLNGTCIDENAIFPITMSAGTFKRWYQGHLT